jgi:Putative lumazine-binding
MPRPFAILAAVVATAVLGGCTQATTSKDSTANFKGEQRLVATTVEDLQSAGAKGDQGTICRQLLAGDLVRSIARGATCERRVDAALKDTDTFDLTVQSVAVAGTKATARVKTENGAKDKTATLGLLKEAGRWKVSDLGR